MTTLNQQEHTITNQNNVGRDITLAQLGGNDGQGWPQAYQTSQSCTVTATTLNIRKAPNTGSDLITSYPQGTSLNFIAVVEGENVAGNPYWGRSVQGRYYWMGGTNRPWS